MPIHKILHVHNAKTGDGAQISEDALPAWKKQGYVVVDTEERGEDDKPAKAKAKAKDGEDDKPAK